MSKTLPFREIALIAPRTVARPWPLANWACSRCKSAMDRGAALAALLLLWPLLLGLAIAVRLSDGGPALFVQTRIGKNGKPFRCFKFRSMALDSAQILQNHLETCPQARAEWAQYQKLSNDPRITAIGALLRKTSLDELPQCLNILFGQMSFVGPRPIVPDEIQRYGENFAHCFSVRPGLTGLWQVSGRSDCTYQQRIALDSQYASEWSLWLDATIILRTVPAVLRQRGSR